ncbi:MAG: hypothetical protein GJU76_00655 [Gallionella sp.]|jgi:hypothetical protein|nr:hypothetical protein [Gallionella sp.]MDH2904564.1 hypothetical protein [Actinomycetota bacterium]
MENIDNGQDSVRYSTNPAWWTPPLLLLLLLPTQIHNRHFGMWLVLDVALLALFLFVFYLLTHPLLTFSQSALARRRGPFRVKVDLSNLESVRVSTIGRQTSVLDPQTGERRSVIRFYVKSPDDWAGKPPVQSISISDRQGRHLTLGVRRTNVNRWGAYLLRAINEQPNVELGPRVIEALEDFTR